MNNCTITAILRDGDRITVQPSKVVAAILRIYRDGAIAGYVLTPRKPDLSFIPLNPTKRVPWKPERKI